MYYVTGHPIILTHVSPDGDLVVFRDARYSGDRIRRLLITGQMWTHNLGECRYGVRNRISEARKINTIKISVDDPFENETQYTTSVFIDDNPVPLIYDYECARHELRIPPPYQVDVFAVGRVIYVIPRHILDLLSLDRPACKIMFAGLVMWWRWHMYELPDVRDTICLLCCELFRLLDYEEYCISNTKEHLKRW